MSEEEALIRARERIDERFGFGRDEAHRILREHVGAKRIYDCALYVLADAEAEIARLKG